MIIRGILVGTCIINDLRDLRVTGGNFYDLDCLFSKDELFNSLKPTDGSLYVALDASLVELIDPNSIDYRTWLMKQSEAERESARKINRRDVSMEMTEYWQMDRPHRKAYVQGLTSSDCVVLDRIRCREHDRDLLDMINERLIAYADVVFPSGFVPL